MDFCDETRLGSIEGNKFTDSKPSKNESKGFFINVFDVFFRYTTKYLVNNDTKVAIFYVRLYILRKFNKH